MISGQVVEHSPNHSPSVGLNPGRRRQSTHEWFYRPWFKSFEAQTFDPPPPPHTPHPTPTPHTPAWDGRLDASGQRRRHLPSSAWTRRKEVKRGKSGGSIGTTDQGNGKGRSGVRLMGTAAYGGKGQGKGKGRGEGRSGQGGRGRSKGGEKRMGTTAYGGKGSKGRAANGDRPVGAASCRRDHLTMASCQPPPPPPTHTPTPIPQNVASSSGG